MESPPFILVAMVALMEAALVAGMVVAVMPVD